MVNSALLMCFIFQADFILLVYAFGNGTIPIILADSRNWEQHCSVCKLSETLQHGRDLDCSKLMLKDFSIKGNCSLMLLNLSSNSLQDIPRLGTSVKLDWFDLSYNKIKILRSRSVKNLRHLGLKVLLLNGNGILRIQSFELISQVLLELQVMDLSGNSLVSLVNFDDDFKWVHHCNDNNYEEGINCENARCRNLTKRTTVLYRSVNISFYPCSYYYDTSNLEHQCEYYKSIIQCVDNGSLQWLNDSTVSQESQSFERSKGNGQLICKMNSATMALELFQEEASTPSTNIPSYSKSSHVTSGDSSREDGNIETTSTFPLDAFASTSELVYSLIGLVASISICVTFYCGWKYYKPRSIRLIYDKWLVSCTRKNRRIGNVPETYVSYPWGDLTPPEDQEDDFIEVEIKTEC